MSDLELQIYQNSRNMDDIGMCQEPQKQALNIPVVITCRLCGSTNKTRVKIEPDGHKHCKNCGNYWL